MSIIFNFRAPCISFFLVMPIFLQLYFNAAVRFCVLFGWKVLHYICNQQQKKNCQTNLKEVAYFVINLHSRAQKKEIKDILCINNR